MELSKYQKAIKQYYIAHPHDNMLVRALAGCGKTFMALELTKLSSTSDIYVAFNTSIAQEFKSKVTNPKVKVNTLHSLAYSIMNSNLRGNTGSKSGGIGKHNSTSANETKLDNLKIYKIIEDLIPFYSYAKQWDFDARLFYSEHFVNLYNLCRLTCTDMSSAPYIQKIIKEYNIFSDYTGEYETLEIEEVLKWLKDIDRADLRQFDEEGVIDFTDMLYITYLKIKKGYWNIPYYNLYTNIWVDEAQDLNNLQLYFLKYIKRKNGRYVFIFDEHQAIYGFSGANTQSCKMIEKLYGGKEFDLPINYRCPSSHLARVNKDFHIPIQPRTDAPKGNIITIKKEAIYKHVKTGDMVISRKNKWLPPVVLDLVSHNIPVYMQDKEMVEGVKRLIQKQKADSLFSLRSKLNSKLNKIYAQAGEGENINVAKADQYTFVIPILENFIKNKMGNSIESFSSYLNKTLNTTNPKDCVRICSVHKAKGLEAENVFVLNEAKVCTDPRNSYEQQVQERNLSYISITRSKNNLYLVEESDT